MSFYGISDRSGLVLLYTLVEDWNHEHRDNRLQRLTATTFHAQVDEATDIFITSAPTAPILTVTSGHATVSRPATKVYEVQVDIGEARRYSTTAQMMERATDAHVTIKYSDAFTVTLDGHAITCKSHPVASWTYIPVDAILDVEEFDGDTVWALATFEGLGADMFLHVLEESIYAADAVRAGIPRIDLGPLDHLLLLEDGWVRLSVQVTGDVEVTASSFDDRYGGRDYCILSVPGDVTQLDAAVKRLWNVLS